MKYVRKPPEPPKAEPMPGPAHVSRAEALDIRAMTAACQALADAADRIRQPAKVEVTVPAISKPKAFTVTVTKRDSKGRVVEFDVKVQDEAKPAEPDAFEQGFDKAKLQ